MKQNRNTYMKQKEYIHDTTTKYAHKPTHILHKHDTTVIYDYANVEILKKNAYHLFKSRILVENSFHHPPMN